MTKATTLHIDQIMWSKFKPTTKQAEVPLIYPNNKFIPLKFCGWFILNNGDYSTSPRRFLSMVRPTSFNSHRIAWCWFSFLLIFEVDFQERLMLKNLHLACTMFWDIHVSWMRDKSSYAINFAHLIISTWQDQSWFGLKQGCLG